MDALARQRELYGARDARLAAAYDRLGSLYERKQWHQLMDALEEMARDERGSWVDRNMIDLLTGFVSKFEAKLNPLRYALFAQRVARQGFVSSPPSAAQIAAAIELLEPVARKPFLDADARVVAAMAVAELHVAAADAPGSDPSSSSNPEASLAKAKALLDEHRAEVTTREGEGGETTSAVKSSFFSAEASYFKRVGPASEFYRAATQFLAHTPLASMPRDRRAGVAEDLCLAALAAEDVFNFGEILDQDVLAELDPSKRWLRDTVLAFHRGDVDGFNAVVDANRAAFAPGGAGAALDMAVLKQKVALLGLMRLVFERPPHEREIAFADVARETRLPLDQVEWLLMRALSKGLIRGTLDGVKETVHVTWLQPRVLDVDQVRVLDAKIVAWTHRVTEAIDFELANPELFARGHV